MIQTQIKGNEMKATIFIVIISFAFFCGASAQSLIEYQAGAVIEVQAGASVCADSLMVSGTFSGSGILCGNHQIILSLTLIVEGLYNHTSNKMVCDTVRVYLRNDVSPYSVVDSSSAVIDSSGAGQFQFSNAAFGSGYYLEVSHRNSIETWSKNPLQITASILNYDFTGTNTQAYGDNMKLIDITPLKYGIYSGDTNQDGLVDGTDLVMIENDANSYLTGYLATDLNGDEIIDGSDALIADNNAANFVIAVTP